MSILIVVQNLRNFDNLIHFPPHIFLIQYRKYYHVLANQSINQSIIELIGFLGHITVYIMMLKNNRILKWFSAELTSHLDKNQSINQSASQSINKSVNQSVNQLIRNKYYHSTMSQSNINKVIKYHSNRQKHLGLTK